MSKYSDFCAEIWCMAGGIVVDTNDIPYVEFYLECDNGFVHNILKKYDYPIVVDTTLVVDDGVSAYRVWFRKN